MVESVIAIVSGVVDSGDVPEGVCHVTAKATTKDCPVGTSDPRAVEFVTGYSLTVVPVGSAPAGTEIVTVPPFMVETIVVGATADAVAETGAPKSADGRELGGGALVGPVAGGGLLPLPPPPPLPPPLPPLLPPTVTTLDGDVV